MTDEKTVTVRCMAERGLRLRIDKLVDIGFAGIKEHDPRGTRFFTLHEGINEVPAEFWTEWLAQSDQHKNHPDLTLVAEATKTAEA